MKEMMQMFALVGAICLWAGAASAATGKSAAFPLDLIEGDRVSAGTEELTFSNLWDGDAEATVTIAQDGAAIFTGLTGEGVKTWTVDRNGRYVLTHTTYTNGVAGKVETAVFVVEGKEVPVGELTIDWGQKSFVYDGQPKEPVIAVKDRETTLTKGTHYSVSYLDNVNVGTAKAIVKGIEPYVGEMTNAFTITKGSLPPDAKPDPIDPDLGDQLKPFSGFDYSGVCDGAPHTIKTNELIEAYAALVGTGMSVSYAAGEVDAQPTTGWSAVAPTYTDVGTNVVWYKVSSANYADIVHVAKVALREPPRVTGVVARQRYPWNGLVDITVTIQGAAEDVAEAECTFVAANIADETEIPVVHIMRNGSDEGGDSGWTRKFTWNAAVDADEVKIDDVSLTVGTEVPRGEDGLGGVQLWDGGPYWAECNVGAAKPEEPGYYFWWGDTVGYRRNGNSWDAVDASRTGFVFGDSFCPTWGLRNASLQSAGYIDTSCNLVHDHDAATAHFGAPWRLPTDSEISALESNCDTEWTTRNGVNGRLVKGRGSYASKSIFLPAAGFGFDVALMEQGLNGACWSSVPKEAKVGSNSSTAWCVRFTADGCGLSVVARYCGRPVRPVRGFAIPAVTTHLSLDCREGDRVSAGTEELTFSNLWDGDVDATVTIAQDGAAIFTGLSGEGVKTWTVDRNGRYELTHTTYTNGVKGKVETAVFEVEGIEVPVSELTIDWGESSFVYDGQPKEPVVTVKDRETTLTKGTHYLVEYKDNVNVGTAKAIVKGIEPYVEEVTNEFTITAAPIGPGGGEEPGPGEIPEGGSSKFDATYVYDGEGHTVNTQALYAVTLVGSMPSFSFSLDGETGWQNEPFVYTNVGECVMWYKITAPNYNDYKHQVKLTIEPRPIGNVTATVADVLYTGKAQTPAVTVKDVVKVGGVDKDIVTAGDYSTAYSDNIGIGTATVTLTGKNNYTGTKVVHFEIFGHPLTKERVSYIVGPYVYDGEPQEPEVIVRDERGNEVPQSGNYTVAYANNVNVGKGTITLTGINQWVGTLNLEFEIVKRQILLKSKTQTWTYDTTAHAVKSVTASWWDGPTDGMAFPEGQGVDIDEASFPSITDIGEKENKFSWKFSEGTSSGNYNVRVEYGNLKVNARPIGDDDKTWDIRLDKAPMYNGEVQSAPIIQVCYVKPDGNLDYIPYTLAGNTATDAGNYKVKISGTGNYTGTVEKDWAIMPRNLKMTSGTEEWMYDGETHSNDTVAVTGDGFVEGEGATYEGFPLVTHFADAAEPVENAFTYKLNENTKAKNYEIVIEKGAVAMTRRPISLTAPTKSKTYDGAALTFAAKDVTVGGEGYAEGEEFTLSNFASITETGQVAATFSIADGTALMDDYDITVTPGATLTVQKSATEITVTAKSKSWTYDGEPHELHEYDATNLGTLVGGDKLEVTFSADSVVKTPIDGENQDGVVENTITSVKVMRGDVDVSDNYTLAWYPGALTVTKRPVTLTSKGASKSYDGTALTKHEVEVGGDGFVGEDGATYTFSGSQLDKGKSKNAFEYSLKSGTNAAYYEITKVEGELEVTALDIGLEDESWMVVLGPALTYSGVWQVQTIASVTLKGLDVDYSVDGNKGLNAKNYEMALTGQGNFKGTKTVTWSIMPQPLTLTASSATKVYSHGTLMRNSVMAEGFVADEGMSSWLCDGWIKDVGTCENHIGSIIWKSNTLESNYSITKVPGLLTITPRPVTVTSNDISKPFDGTPLKLTAADIVVDNMALGEKFVFGNFAERTAAGQTSGTFSIAAGANTKLTNYAITPVYGTITITKSATEIGVTARSKSWPYDATTHDLHEYDATNLNILQPGEELVVTFKEASKVTTPKDGPAEDGKVANEIESIRVVKNGTQDVTDNYTVTPYPGLLTVTKRPVTVTVEGETVSATYDGEEHTASGYDIATEDELYDIAAKTTFGGTDEVTRTDAGKSDMGLKPSDFTNTDEYFDVTYAVTDGWVDIAQADISAGEDGDFVLTLGVNPKYNGTVQTIPVTAVTYKGLPVTYTLAGENATHAGTYTLTVKANGNFKGERSTTWQILKRQMTLTSASASKKFNGAPLVAKTVSVTGDGWAGEESATYDVTGTQTTVGATQNTFTYALTNGAKEGNYTITKVEGILTVTQGDVVYTAQGYAAEYDGNGHSIAVNVTTPGGLVPKYALMPEGPYSATLPTFTNVCTDVVVWYALEADQYASVTNSATVTIAKRPLTATMVNAIADQTYTGSEIKPLLTFTDAGNRIIAAEDYTATYSDNTVAGTASVKITGKRNYAGEVTVTFKIVKANYDMSGAKWNYTTAFTYDKTEKSVSVTGLPAGVTVKAIADGRKTHAGDYVAKVSFNYDADNYNEPKLVDCPWKINRKTLAITADAKTQTFGKAELPLTYKAPALCAGDALSGSLVRDPGTNVGKYVIRQGTLAHADYTITFTGATYEIVKAAINGGDEPGSGEIPAGGVSKFDAVAMYDGKGHTIKTNELVAAFKAIIGNDFAVSYAMGESGGQGLSALPPTDASAWMTVAPDFTNVCETSVWYKVTSANYQDFVHEAKVTVTNRPVTLMSGTKIDFTYDGKPHAFTNLTVTAGSFVAGEGIATSDWATVTAVAEGQVPNTFDYVVLDGTKLSNYDLTIVTGKIAVVSPDAVFVTVTGHVSNVVYDGTKKSVSGYDVVSISDPLYTAADFTFTGQSATNGTNAGTYPMGLMSSDFANTNANFSSVVFNVTDGRLVIAQAANAWTVEPAIEGWTYGETAKTPVGAAKFGEVSFAYSPMPVGAAGDYTMTATVAGTANYTGLSKAVGFKISKGALPGGGEEPGGGSVPAGGVSKFDAVAMYDGEGHTIKTNELVAAFKTAVGGDVTVRYGVADGEGAVVTQWLPIAPDFTNVCVTSVWYKVRSANYQDFVHEAKVAITNRPVTVTSGTKLDFAYDGKPHAYTNLTVTAGSFVVGEGIATSNWATVTAVVEGQVPNSFDYVALDGTKLSNYDLTVVTGKIAVVMPPVSTVKVVLDAIGGKVQGKNVVTQDVVGIYGTLPDASRENYIFDGWFLGVSNDSPQAVSGGAVLAEGNHTLFARWFYDPSVTPDPTTIYKWEAIDANTARIIGFLNANQQLQKMILPDRIGGRFVTEIGASAFANTKCGVKELVLPMFCVVINSKAFSGIETLETISFAAARQWNDPVVSASVAIGTYAFSGAKALTGITLCKEIASLGNYAFLNTRNLSSITILGKPTVGTQVFRSSGMDAGGVTIHLDPALASDTAYMAALKANMSNVTVKTDAIVTSLTMSTLGMRGTSVRLTVSVEKAAEWGQVDLGAIRVKYRNTLSDPATVLTPTAATRNADGTVTLEVAPPEGTSGFFQTIIKR